MIKNILEEQKEIYILLSLATVFLVCTNIRIWPYFSSNYIFQFVPFLVLVCRQYYQRNPLQLLVNIIGILMGFVALLRAYGTGDVIRHLLK